MKDTHQIAVEIVKEFGEILGNKPPLEAKAWLESHIEYAIKKGYRQGWSDSTQTAKKFIEQNPPPHAGSDISHGQFDAECEPTP